MAHARHSCWVSGRSEQAEKARGRQNEGMSRRGGWSTCITAPSVRRSVAPLHQASCSKSSLCIYLHVLPRLRRINAVANLPKSTPIKTGISSTTPYTTNHLYQIDSVTTVGKEMARFLIGPMPSQLFLDTFFPTEKISNLDNVPSFEPNCYRHVVTGNRSEKQAYQPFVSQISYSYRVSSMLTIFKATSTQRFMPGFRVVNSSSSVDRNPTAILHPIKPDISVYCDDTGPNVITDSSLVEIFIELKWYPRDDPFYTMSNAGVKKSFLHRTIKANDTLGQITIYTAAQLGSQFYTHAFSVFILRDKARII